MPFVKLDCGILNSSLWADKAARDVFLTALLLAKPAELGEQNILSIREMKRLEWVLPTGSYGLVEASSIGILHLADLQTEAGLDALQRLSEPDVNSRNDFYEGRRMVRINGGYAILNYDYYRSKDPPPQATADTVGYVYYVSSPGSGRIKIGFSKNPWARLSDLRVTDPKLQLLATEKGSLLVEHHRHKHFANERIEGEWFRTTARLEHFIGTLTTGVATGVDYRSYEEAEAEAEVQSTPPTPSRGSEQSLQGTAKMTWEMALKWLDGAKKAGADYTEAEARGAFLCLEAGGWMWGKRPIADPRAALERQIQTDRQRNFENNGQGNGDGAPTQAQIVLYGRELERVLKRMDSIKGQYGDMQSWDTKDKTEYQRLRLRKGELKKMLGVTI